MGMSASQSLESEINILSTEAEMGIEWAQRELAIALARRDVRNNSRSLEQARRTLMTSDLQFTGMFMIIDSHKIISRVSKALAESRERLALAYSQR